MATRKKKSATKKRVAKKKSEAQAETEVSEELRAWARRVGRETGSSCRYCRDPKVKALIVKLLKAQIAEGVRVHYREMESVITELNPDFDHGNSSRGISRHVSEHERTLYTRWRA